MNKTIYIKPTLEVIKANHQEMMINSLPVNDDTNKEGGEGSGHGGGSNFGGIDGLAKSNNLWDNSNGLWDD